MSDTYDFEAQLLVNILNSTNAAQFDKKVFSCDIKQHKIYCGTCPDDTCLTPLHYSSQDYFVDCFKCLKTHYISTLFNTYETELKKTPLRQIPNSITDFVKVNGQSNCSCKLLSPLLTKHGMNKAGKPVLLKDIGHDETVNCGKLLGGRSFKISPDYINVKGYGKDISGSFIYLKRLFDRLEEFHNGENRLVAIHTDGDGHCLLHALSRALIGLGLFWHGLRTNLHDHLKEHRVKYMELLKNFFDEHQWNEIIEEADPNCSTEGKEISFLGNPHIFALSNILRRPIILFDSPQKLQSAADYAGLFVPALLEPSECTTRSPLCIAWSGNAHNHFVALVAVDGRPLPTIPEDLIPEPWAVGLEIAQRYLSYNKDGSLPVCDGKPLKMNYVPKLAHAMGEVFIDRYGVALCLVEDYRRYCLKSFQLVLSSDDIIKRTAQAIIERRLFRCLQCGALEEIDNQEPKNESLDAPVMLPRKLQPEVDSLKNQIKPLREDTGDGVTDSSRRCHWCGTETTRLVDRFGKVCYKNGDEMESSNGSCGKKFYWNGKEYDKKPLQFTLSWNKNQEEVEISIVWFYGDSSSELNSNCTSEAIRVVQNYFPDEINADKLVAEVSDMIEKKCIALGVLKIKQSTQKFIAKKSPNSSTKRKEIPEKTLANMKGHVKRQEPTEDHLQQSTSTSPSNTRSNSPTDSFTTSVQKASTHITVKVSEEGGSTKTLKLDPNIGFRRLQEEIYREFKVKPSQQVLKIGHPPELLVPPDNSGPLGLKSHDQIRLRKTKTTEKIPHYLKTESSEVTTSNANVLAELNKPSETARLVEPLMQNGLSTKWRHAMDRPELFYPGGCFYEEFKRAVGLKPDQHGCLSLLPGLALLYNHRLDRIELCLEPKGHFPVDEQTKRLIERYFHPQESHSIVHSDSLLLHRHGLPQLLEHA